MEAVIKHHQERPDTPKGADEEKAFGMGRDGEHAKPDQRHDCEEQRTCQNIDNVLKQDHVSSFEITAACLAATLLCWPLGGIYFAGAYAAGIIGILLFLALNKSLAAFGLNRTTAIRLFYNVESPTLASGRLPLALTAGALGLAIPALQDFPIMLLAGGCGYCCILTDLAYVTNRASMKARA